MELFAPDGAKLTDVTGGICRVPLGYCRRELNSAAFNGLERLTYVNLDTETENASDEYATRLTAACGGDFVSAAYTSSGVGALRGAAAAAMEYYSASGRGDSGRILVLDMSSHAAELSDMNITLLRAPYFLSDTHEERVGLLADIEHCFAAHDIAAVIIEPVSASVGLRTLPQWYQKELFAAIRAENALIIADERLTGFGRTGKPFAYTELTETPDILCLSDAATNGMLPVGILLTGKRAADVCVPHAINPLVCQIGCEALKLYSRLCVSDAINRIGAAFEAMLEAECVGEIRRTGMMLCVELEDECGAPLSVEKLTELRGKLFSQGYAVMLYCVPDTASGLMLMPSYIMTKKSAAEIASAIGGSLRGI